MKRQALLIGCLALPGCVVAPPGIGTMVYVHGETVAAYAPEPALVTPVTVVDRARFPAIDVHCHWSIDVDPEAMLRAMDERNVAVAVNLSGGHGDDLNRMLQRFHEPWPDRFLIFANIDFARIDEPGFGERVARELAEARARGLAGLKIFKSLGLTVRDASGRIVPIDDARLDPIWAACGELNMPVLIHSADPRAFFEPVDGRNERWMQLKRHPGWAFPAERFPPRETVLAQRAAIMRRHRGTTFIGPHMGGRSEDLAAAARMLRDHPNMVLDISGRVGELGRQPYASRRFIIEFQDRVLFGTDRYPGRPDQPRYRIYYRFLETDDEYFRYYDNAFPPAGDWRIYGVFLPDDVLKQVYFDNAARVLGLDAS